MRQALARVLWCIHRIEDLLLVGLLLSMISIAFTQIVLRNGFDGGIAWADLSLIHISEPTRPY